MDNGGVFVTVERFRDAGNNAVIVAAMVLIVPVRALTAAVIAECIIGTKQKVDWTITGKGWGVVTDE